MPKPDQEFPDPLMKKLLEQATEFYEEAETMYQRVVDAQEANEELGEDHPETLLSVNFLSEVHVALHTTKCAAGDPMHPKGRITRESFGAHEDIRAAIPLLFRVLKQKKANLPGSRSTLRCMYDMGVLVQARPARNIKTRILGYFFRGPP